MEKQYTGPNQKKIQQMFNSIADGYDTANSTLSLGIHSLWKKKLIRLSGAKAGSNVLDCATGTGDLAFLFERVTGNTGYVAGCDFSQQMLDVAHKRADENNSNVEFLFADVTQLPFEENSFDITSISFGIRNVEDPVKGISELARVTKPGGKVMILEFGQPKLPGWKKVFGIYSKYILPTIGGIITGKKDAYDYLETSSANFPCREQFIALAKQAAPFSETKVTSLSGGIAYMYELTVK